MVHGVDGHCSPEGGFRRHSVNMQLLTLPPQFPQQAVPFFENLM